MLILETERLVLREIDSAVDAEFIFELVNSPKFIKYIGDRGVRQLGDAIELIEGKYRQSYEDHGYGLYTVECKSDRMPVGVCGLVRRVSLPGPDIGFAFLSQYERMGYGFESAAAIVGHARTVHKIPRLFAITTPDNIASGRLLDKLGFTEGGSMVNDQAEELKVFHRDL